MHDRLPPPPATRSTRPAPKPPGAGARPPSGGASGSGGQGTGGRAPAAGGHLPPASHGGISAEAERQERLAQGKYEARAAALRMATATRPALVVQADVDACTSGHKTWDGRLAALERLARGRALYWEVMRGTGEVHPDDLTEFARQEAAAFFERNGVALAPDPAPAATAPERTAAAPAPKPEAAPGPNPPRNAPGVAAEVEFEDEHGYPWRLRLGSESAPETVSYTLGLVKRAGDALHHMKAKPRTVQIPPSLASTATGVQAGPPKCKYHGAMKPSKKPGAWYCPKKLADGSYCDQKWEGEGDGGEA